MRWHRLLIFAAFAALLATHGALGGVADAYLSAYLEMFPTRATQAGNDAFDSKLEDFSTEKLARWVEINQAERDRLTKLLPLLIYRSTIAWTLKRCSPRSNAKCTNR